ncbi:MAG TPA: ubiquinol-cytochrome c reductase iron-sulfur subunit [Gemmatimonadales bacterium]|nr:ubiquinol-cytochrome c reductase iron-sulfur subunit [Gemmatimonadales bacterium]
MVQPAEPGTRRRFLKWLTGIGAIGSAALAGIPALRAFISPIFGRAAPQSWVKLGEADLFDPDVPTKVDFAQTVTDAWVESRELHSVWVTTADGEHFTVFSGRCTHLGCSFAYDKAQKRFQCPCHQGMFDPKTGAVLGGPPPRPLDQLETKIDKGDLYVAYQDFRVGTAQKIAV